LQDQSSRLLSDSADQNFSNHRCNQIWQHREGLIPGFSKRYGCKTLVWWAYYPNLHDARAREVQIKGWKRAWKIELIEKDNPDWRDLWPDLNR
jgi:putative endonuclease